MTAVPSRRWSFTLRTLFTAVMAFASLGMFPLRADDATWAIFVMRVDGSTVRQVARAEGFKAHGSPRWSHDGKRLAFDASGGRGSARKFFLVNVDGNGLRELGDHAMPDWSADDKQLIYTNYGAAGAKAGTWVQNLDGQGRTWVVDGICARWSPDGSHIVYMDMPEELVMTLDLVQNEARVLYDGNYERIEPGFDWSLDGKRLAVIGVNNSRNQRDLVIVSSNVSESRVRLSQPRLEGPIAWSPDGKQLALTIDHLIYLLDVDGAGAPQPIAGQIARNSDPAWSPDGKWIAFASDRPLSVVSTARAVKRTWQLAEVARHAKGSIVYSLGFTPDGRRVVMGGDPVNQGVQVWDLASGETRNLGGSGIHIAMFPDGLQFATSWLSPTIQIIKIDSGEVAQELHHGDTVRTIAVSKDGSRLVSGGLDKVLHVWDISAGERICTFDAHQQWITRALFSADSKEVISAAHDKKLRLWDARTGKQRLEIEHPDVIWGLAVSPDGTQVLTGTGGPLVGNPLLLSISESKDNLLRLWDTASGKVVREMKGHTHAVFTIDISPDGRLAVSGGWDGTIRLWNLHSGEELSRVESEQGRVAKVLFSPDGQQVIVGGGGRRLENGRIAEFPNEQIRLYRVTEHSEKPARSQNK